MNYRVLFTQIKSDLTVWSQRGQEADAKINVKCTRYARTLLCFYITLERLHGDLSGVFFYGLVGIFIWETWREKRIISRFTTILHLVKAF